ncbi:hypothetical protein AMJ80_01110 [bacterium SM23_31]|nr:MAG: hypothetical protein AMJ80_01110 [bacterium SM23_31]
MKRKLKLIIFNVILFILNLGVIVTLLAYDDPDESWACCCYPLEKSKQWNKAKLLLGDIADCNKICEDGGWKNDSCWGLDCLDHPPSGGGWKFSEAVNGECPHGEFPGTNLKCIWTKQCTTKTRQWSCDIGEFNIQ